MTTLTATGQVIAGRYELIRFVAGGAMGEVWEAHDERMDRGLDPFRAAGLIAQAADAVHAAHLAGVVHRDLTPGNLLVCDGDVVKTAQAMAKEPADRPDSAAKLVTRLREVARQRPVSMPGNTMAWDWFRSPPVAAAPDSAPKTRSLPKMVAPDNAPDVAADPPPDAAKAPAPQRPDRTLPPAPERGAAAVRLATSPPNGRQDTRAAFVPRWWSTLSRSRWVGVGWRRHPVSRIGLAGGAVVLLVVLTVLWDGSRANAVPGIDTAGPGAGTVRVGDDAGKGVE